MLVLYHYKRVRHEGEILEASCGGGRDCDAADRNGDLGYVGWGERTGEHPTFDVIATGTVEFWARGATSSVPDVLVLRWNQAYYRLAQGLAR